MAASIKARNPKVLVGMYWRIDGALEIAKKGCSNYTAELAELGTDIFLKVSRSLRSTHLVHGMCVCRCDTLRVHTILCKCCPEGRPGRAHQARELPVGLHQPGRGRPPAQVTTCN